MTARLTRRRFASSCALLAAPAAWLGTLSAARAVVPGDAAPPFELKDTAGHTVRLADFQGRHVVLEWTNPGCPFVQKHYSTHNMQSLQKEFTDRQVAWLLISSTARGMPDYLDPAALGAKYKGWGSADTALLVDESGRVGKVYGAKTTPHMFVIDPNGRLVYAGGIDDKRSADPVDVKTARNFVRAALGESLSGKAVSTPAAPPYGCSVKYAV